MEKGVAILGGNSRREHWPDYDQKRWEVWGVNSIRPHWVNRWDRMFNLHRFSHLERDCPQYVDWDTTWSRRNPKVPLYVCDSWGGLLTNELLYPLARIQRLPRGGLYHAGSFDMLVAMAVLMKAKDIRLHGIGLNNESGEPISARACMEYWCGVAEGRGIPVFSTPDCDLFLQYHIVKSRTVYGFDDVKLVEDKTGEAATPFTEKASAVRKVKR